MQPDAAAALTDALLIGGDRHFPLAEMIKVAHQQKTSRKLHCCLY